MSSQGPPRTMKEAAAALNISRRWPQEFLKTIRPCWLQAGRRKLFDEAAMGAIKEAMREKARESRPDLYLSPRRGRPIGAFGRSRPGSALAEALALAEVRMRKKGRVARRNLTAALSQNRT